MKRLMMWFVVLGSIALFSASCGKKDPVGPNPPVVDTATTTFTPTIGGGGSNTATPTSTPSLTAVLTNTSTPTVTVTSTATVTRTATATRTPTVTVTPTNTVITHNIQYVASGAFASGSVIVRFTNNPGTTQDVNFSVSPASYTSPVYTFAAGVTVTLNIMKDDGTFDMSNGAVTMLMDGLPWKSYSSTVTNLNRILLTGVIPTSLSSSSGTPTNIQFTSSSAGDNEMGWILADGTQVGVVQMDPIISPVYQFYSGEQASLGTCWAGGPCNSSAATILANGSPVTTGTGLYGVNLFYIIP